MGIITVGMAKAACHDACRYSQLYKFIGDFSGEQLATTLIIGHIAIKN
jgi:hypothetical protein